MQHKRKVDLTIPEVPIVLNGGIPKFKRCKNLCQHYWDVGNFAMEFTDKMFFKKMDELNDGLTFGDVALWRKIPRSANVKCEKELTEMVYLTEEAYNRTLAQISEKKVND